MEPKIGLQLWSIQEACQADFYGALKQVKKSGYDGVEFAGYYGKTAAEITTMLTELELEVAASHIPYEALKNNFEETISFEKKIGNHRIVVPFASFETWSEWQGFIKELNEIASKVKDVGLELYYHNHAHEFTQISGKNLLEEMLAEIPSLQLEVDLYWVAFSKTEVLSWVDQHAERIKLLHIKDMQENPKESTEIAAGILPIKTYVEVAKKLAIPWLIVEQEAFQKYPPLEAVAIDYLQLKALVEEVYV